MRARKPISGRSVTDRWRHPVVVGHTLRRWAGLACVTLVLSQAGCAGSLSGGSASDGALTQPNPVTIPAVPVDFLWDQLVDELDNYFPIRREERVRQVRNQLTRGWIETYPVIGSSVLEPWRVDAAYGFEKWHGTLQSIRRWARVVVVPHAEGYDIQVFVFKELEDVDRPLNGNGALAPRHSVSMERDQDPTWFEPGSYGWIDLGRDHALEQKILANLVGRVTGP